MLSVGVQTMGIVEGTNPWTGFELLRRTGFSCTDFSLQDYLPADELYKNKRNDFFSRSIRDIEDFFTSHKQAAQKNGIFVAQMHMPFPIYIPGGDADLNKYLQEEMMPKSLAVSAFFECPYIVVHGVRMVRQFGSEEAEWSLTKSLLESIAPQAKELGVTLCLENLYDSVGGHLVEGPCSNIPRTVERIERLNDKYGAEVFGFCLDTGHANILGVDFVSWIKQLEHHLKVLHIHDNDGRTDCHQIPFTFTGSRNNLPSTDWPGFCRGLREIRFDGVLNFETGPSLNTIPPELHEDMLKFLAAIGRHFIRMVEV